MFVDILLCFSDGIVMVPIHIAEGIEEDARNDFEEPRKIPQTIQNWLCDIREGIVPYPRSKAEASEIWKGVSSIKQMERIKQLRERSYNRFLR